MRHAAVQGARGRAARRLRERDKRERVRGGRPRTIYRWVWAGRTACVAGRPLGTMLSRWVAWPSKGISNQLRSAEAALQRLPSSRLSHRTRTIGQKQSVAASESSPQRTK